MLVCGIVEIPAVVFEICFADEKRMYGQTTDSAQALNKVWWGIKLCLPLPLAKLLFSSAVVEELVLAPGL